MSLNEAAPRTRSRWPVQFDIEGVPRDPRVRADALEKQNQENPMQISQVKRKGKFDFNNPKSAPYQHQEFPRLVYKLAGPDTARHKSVASEEELEKALAKGWVVNKKELFPVEENTRAIPEQGDDEEDDDFDAPVLEAKTAPAAPAAKPAPVKVKGKAKAKAAKKK